MRVLALEASTSSAKAMLFEPESGLCDVVSAEYPADICDTVTIDPAAAVSCVLACGRRVLEKNATREVAAVGLSSIWHSLLLLDAERAPLGRVQTWADTSPASTVSKYKNDRDLCRRLYRATGCAQHSIYNMWKWMHLKETGNVSGAAYLSSMGEYLFEALTGKALISASAAAGSAMMSARSLDWDDEILKFAGVTRSMLSDIAMPSETVSLAGIAAAESGLPAGTPVVVTNPDGGLNQIAAGGLREGLMTLSVGTSGALRMASPRPVLPEDPSTWCYYGDEGMYIAGAATSGAGNCVQWYAKRLFGGQIDYPSLDRMAASCDRSGAPYFLPFLFGERCPGWADSRRGGFFGVSAAHQTGELFYAVLEGVLFNLYQNYLLLVETMKNAPEAVAVSGGIIKSPVWMEMAADLFGVPLCESRTEHSSLLGAAWMACKAAGGIAALKEIPREKGVLHTAKRAGRELLLKRYATWLTYYDMEV